ncbi:hypothetical protein [Stenotrophomonas acidaminiphila]
MPQNPVDAESATIASYWLALVSFGIGIVGIGFSIYAFFAKNPDALLVAGSGWLAAMLIGISAWVTTTRLLRYVKARESELRGVIESSHKDVQSAKLETQSIQIEHERLLSISEYLVSKTVRRATKRTVPAEVNNNDAENEGAN